MRQRHDELTQGHLLGKGQPRGGNSHFFDRSSAPLIVEKKGGRLSLLAGTLAAVATSAATILKLVGFRRAVGASSLPLFSLRPRPVIGVAQTLGERTSFGLRLPISDCVTGLARPDTCRRSVYPPQRAFTTLLRRLARMATETSDTNKRAAESSTTENGAGGAAADASGSGSSSSIGTAPGHETKRVRLDEESAIAAAATATATTPSSSAKSSPDKHHNQHPHQRHEQKRGGGKQRGGRGNIPGRRERSGRDEEAQGAAAAAAEASGDDGEGGVRLPVRKLSGVAFVWAFPSYVS